MSSQIKKKLSLGEEVVGDFVRAQFYYDPDETNCILHFYFVLYFLFLCSVIFFCCVTLDEILEQLFVQWMFVELENRDNDLIKNMAAKFNVAISHVETILCDRKFICGDE